MGNFRKIVKMPLFRRSQIMFIETLHLKLAELWRSYGRWKLSIKLQGKKWQKMVILEQI